MTSQHAAQQMTVKLRLAAETTCRLAQTPKTKTKGWEGENTAHYLYVLSTPLHTFDPMYFSYLK